ncbi:hypothetical protein ACFQX6_03085 [Streptosporangium lutulentum]
MVAVFLGDGSPVQPSLDSGSASGAVKDRAVTVASSKPTPSRCRIMDTAWYRCVEETCTEVTSPRTPSRTSASLAA